MDGEITPDELASLLDGPGDGESGSDDGGEDAVVHADSTDLRIVDIRNRGPFEREHIPGSENIPAPELTDRIEELDGAGHVVTVCPHGKASVQAARLVSSYEGVDGPAESLRGGLEAWDGPIEGVSEGERVGSGGKAGGRNGAGEGGAGKGGMDEGEASEGGGDGSTAPF